MSTSMTTFSASSSYYSECQDFGKKTSFEKRKIAKKSQQGGWEGSKNIIFEKAQFQRGHILKATVI